MRIWINERSLDIGAGQTLGDIRDVVAPATNLALLNGVSQPHDTLVQEGDHLFFIDGQCVPEKDIYRGLWASRYGGDNFQKLQEAAVVVAGCGGLGSHIAISLARLGIGKMLLVDGDVVDLTNLGRQNYFPKDLGKAKVEALAEQVRALTPLTTVETWHGWLTAENIPELLGDYPYLCEAFDDPGQKAMLVNTALSQTQAIIIGASGMSGSGEANMMQVRKVFERLYMCGDGVSDRDEKPGLLAPRVMLCAAQQATTLMNIILNS